MGIHVKYLRGFSLSKPFHQGRQSVGQHSPPTKTVQRHPGDRHVLSIVDVWFVGSGEGLSSPLHWEVSRPTLDHHLSRDGSGQLSPRSPSVADQREKVECRMRKLASTMPKVGYGKRKLKGQMLNVGWRKMNVHSTEREGRIWKLDCCLWKVECRKRKLECCINQSWIVNAKKLNRKCKLKRQTQNVG